MKVKITTTLDPEVYSIAKEKSIPLTEALTRGILLLSKERLPPPSEIVEKELANYKLQKVINANTKLQDVIHDRNKEIGKIQNVLKNLEKKKI